MKMTDAVQKILSFYESDAPGIKAKLAQLMMHGRLGGTGRLIILPVDQGFEHGPNQSFCHNPHAFDPLYHFKLAIEAGLSAYAAPLGMLEAGANTFAGQIPLILKMNSANSLVGNTQLNQAMTGSIQDAIRLGCLGVGFTIYPGSEYTYDMFEHIQELSREARAHGLFTVIWSYPRGNMSKEGETAIDVVSYGAHMAALLGAHIIKVKLPTSHMEKPLDKQALETSGFKLDILKDRVEHVMRCSFKGRRIVVFSGGASKSDAEILEDAQAIHDGGGHGSIMGRNAFQRPHHEAIALLDKLVEIYKGA
jgi:class I fructose-bisphosphate aldolase